MNASATLSDIDASGLEQGRMNAGRVKVRVQFERVGWKGRYITDVRPIKKNGLEAVVRSSLIGK